MHPFLTSSKNQHRFTNTHIQKAKIKKNYQHQKTTQNKRKTNFHAHLSLFSIQHNRHTSIQTTPAIDWDMYNLTRKPHFCADIQSTMPFIPNPIETGVVYCVLCVIWSLLFSQYDEHFVDFIAFMVFVFVSRVVSCVCVCVWTNEDFIAWKMMNTVNRDTDRRYYVVVYYFCYKITGMQHVVLSVCVNGHLVEMINHEGQ